MKTIAIIPARGGSKRISRKNLRDFCGNPIITYSIQTALASECFDEIMVSTDDAEIAEVALRTGATVPFYRSADTSDDYAGTAEVLIEVLTEYVRRGYNFENCCCLYPTAPLVTTTALKVGLQRLNSDTNINSVVPVVRFAHPIQR